MQTQEALQKILDRMMQAQPPEAADGTDAAEPLDGALTLAEALQLRADAQKKISQLSARLQDNAKVQEGDLPAEPPMALLALLRQHIAQYEQLIRRINDTNAHTQTDGGTLSNLLARRDALRLHHSVLRGFAQEASRRVDRYSKAEIRILSTVDVAALQKDVDALAKELRQLDARIQRLNWTTPLR